MTYFNSRRKKFGVERLQAKYICHFGYEMMTGRRRFKKNLIKKKKNLICKNGLWVGKLPSCRKNTLTIKSHRCSTCDQLCFKTSQKQNMGTKCGCFKGFDLVNNSSCVGKFVFLIIRKNKKCLTFDIL